MLKLNVIKPVDQSWSIKKISEEASPVGWESVFEDAKNELRDVSDVLDEQERLYGTYYPLKKDIFAAFNITQLKDVKVVIVGQDPYHQSVSINGRNVPRATGLSFSVRREDGIPSSLNNIYTEIENTVHGFRKPDHGDLRQWAKQGVLLLNTCLTVRQRQAGSHGDIWLGFMSKVFKAISVVNPSCIYLLWGREAQKIKPMLGERSVVLEAMHPSGFSARKGFFGCNHFNITNEKLVQQGKVGINWKISRLSELDAPKVHVNRNPNFTPVHVNNLHPINTKNISENKEKPSLPPPIPEIKMNLSPQITNVKTNFQNPNIQNTQITGLPIINHVV